MLAESATGTADAVAQGRAKPELVCIWLLVEHCFQQVKFSAFFAKIPLAAQSVPAYTLLDCGPFVYRLGRQVFNLERGVRFP